MSTLCSAEYIFLKKTRWHRSSWCVVIWKLWI